MTNEEAIKYGIEWLKDEYLDAKDGAFIKIALEALEQEPYEVSEYDKDHIWYKGHQYISLRRFLEVKAEAEQEPCEDAISRQAVLDYINRILNQGTGKKKSFEFIQKYVEKLPPVTPKPKWIRVREKLPEEGEEVLVSDYDTYNKRVIISRYQGEQYGFTCGLVSAWMPLPKPYEPQERSNKE